MNKDQVKGAVKNVAGKVQQQVGETVDSKKQEVQGVQKQVAGKTQQTYGDAKEAIKKPR